MSTYVPPGGYAVPVEAENDPEIELRANVRRPPEPGAEAAGPALAPLVQELGLYRAAMERLAAEARYTAHERLQNGVSTGQLDGSGNAVLHLFSVPQGATGYLMFCTLDEAGATPAAPDTSGTAFHAIYSAAGAGIGLPLSNVVGVGALLDFQLNAPTRGDAMLPDVYKYYGDRYGAPSVVGPASFYAVFSGFTASRQIAAGWQVLVVQPEP